jgi:hypothetical protein
MPRFQVSHRHDASECGAAFAAWRGFESPLRGHETLCSCPSGGHRLWWTVDAQDPAAALALLPPWVARRSRVEPVSDFVIP